MNLLCLKLQYISSTLPMFTVIDCSSAKAITNLQSLKIYNEAGGAAMPAIYYEKSSEGKNTLLTMCTLELHQTSKKQTQL
jgi:hypothetical protein